MAFGDQIQSPIPTQFDEGTTVAVTLSQTGTSGNLLVACHFDRASGQTAPTDQNSDVFTQAVVVDDAGNADDLGIWYKISEGDETVITCNAGGSDYQTACVIEIEGPFDATPLDDATAGEVAEDTTAYSGQAAASIATAVAIAAVSLRDGAGNNIDSWDNSFVEAVEYHEASYNNVVAAAIRVLSASGNYSTVGNLDASFEHIGAIAIFKGVGGGGGISIPVVINHLKQQGIS